MNKERKTKELKMNDVELFELTTNIHPNFGREAGEERKKSWKRDNVLDQIFTKLAKKTRIRSVK